MSNFETLLTEIRKDTSGKSFEVFCKWFLENDPYWKTQVEKVWLWDDWPERWGADKGIDLVFKHKSGQNWAIQSKCYSDDYYIKKEDIDSFLSESNRKNIHQRLLIGSTDRIGKNARETMSGQEKPVRPLLLSDLKASGLDYPSSLKKLGSKGNKKKINKDRPYQQQAIKKVVEGFKSHDRGKLIMACGTGKTLVTLWIKEKLKPKTTLVLLPSLNLLSQTLFEWTTHSKDPFEVLCICSDTTVGKQDRNEDMKVTDAYFDVTSDVSTISQFLKLDKPKVIFCTYQSSDLVSKAQKKEEIDFVICDEAHRCTGLAKSTFTRVLDNKNIKAKKRLFTTATPRIFSSAVKTVASKEGKEIYGMDDEKIYGPDFFEYTFGQAIDDKWLTDYQVVIVGVDEPTVKASIDERELIALDNDKYEDAETLASKISVAKAIKDYDITRMISFHNRVKDAQNFSKDFHDVLKLLNKKDKPKGTIWTDFISGQMSTKDRKLKLQQLKELSASDRGIISNAKCLSEGVDVPTLDGVAFVEPKGSQIDIIQSVGRALRKSEEKNIGTIILPVFLNKDADEIKTIENSNFKPVWDVLKALRSHDERLADELDNLRIFLGNRKTIIGKRFPQKIIFDLPKEYKKSFSESLKIILVKRTTESWYDGYNELLKYFKEIKSNKPVIHFKNEGNFNLSTWVDTQRTNYKSKKLTKKRILLLEELDQWLWNPFDYQWNEILNKVKKFVKKNNGIFPTENEFIGKDYNLGHWIRNQRNNYKNNKLPKDRIKKLEGVPGWTWNPIEEKWFEGYKALLQYVSTNKDKETLNFKKNFTKFNLVGWADRQKSAYKNNKLDQDKIKKLENVRGWSWNPYDEKWNYGYSELKRYILQNKGLSKTAKLVTKTKFKLGNWISLQRSNYKKDKLTKDKIHLLEELDSWSWDGKLEKEKFAISELKSFLKVNKHSSPKNEFVTKNGFKLGTWVAGRRSDFKKGKLSKDMIKTLEALPGWSWNPLEDNWEDGLNHLKKYIKTIKILKIPNSFKTDDGFRLGAWVRRQKLLFRDKKISNERINILEAIPQWSWKLYSLKDMTFKSIEKNRKLWMIRYSSFKKFYNQTNNPNPSINKNFQEFGFNIKYWIQNQKSKFKNKKLTKEQVELLEKIPGWKWYEDDMK